MKIRLISDLHIDINSNYPLDLHRDGANDVYTLIAGDICGSPTMAVEWVKRNIHQGAIVSGNHDVYDTTMPIEEVKEFFHKEFPESGNITFFDNDVGVVSKEIADGILLVADVMYTDYMLPIPWRNPRGDQSRNMMLADPYKQRSGGMNDFNYGKCKKKYVGENDKRSSKIFRDDVWRLVPQWYLDHHERAFAKITEVIESNKDKQVILMAHHGLSPRCIDDNYHEYDTLDASYVSDKEDWIKTHNNVKCIVSGHIHCRKKFNVGECLYVMNALGYCDRHLKQYNKDTKKWENWTPNCFIDTDNWSVEWNDVENKEWEETKKKSDEKFMRLAPFFM